MSSHIGATYRDGVSGTARGGLAGERPQLGERFPVAPIADEGEAGRTTAGPASPPIYRADCGACGGRGGQECHGDLWADCPVCVSEVPCALCGDPVDVRDVPPAHLVIDGRLQAVCDDCNRKEPDQ